MFPCIFAEVTRPLSFAACETRQCVNVNFVVDLVDEIVEEFDVSLERTIGLDTSISLRPSAVDARVFINDDIECKSAFCIKQIALYNEDGYPCFLLHAFIHCPTTVYWSIVYTSALWKTESEPTTHAQAKLELTYNITVCTAPLHKHTC